MAKAGRPKNGSTGLPDWFDIKKYLSVRNLKTLGWYQQLSIRFLLNALRASNPFGSQQLENLCLLLKEDPILTVERLMEAVQNHRNDDKDETQFGNLYLTAYIGLTRQAHGVADAINADIFAAYCRFPEKVRESLSEDELEKMVQTRTIAATPQGLMTEITEIDEFLKKDHNDCFDVEGPLAGCLVSKINILLPEKVLVREFKTYMREKKKRYGKCATPFFRNPDFEDWYNNGFLPYLDLLLLDGEEAAPIRWPAFADALNQITDAPIGGDSALAKANKANISKLISPITLQMLSIQAAREEAGTLSKSGKFLVS